MEKANLCMTELQVTEIDESVQYVCAVFDILGGARNGMCKFQIVGTDKPCVYAENEDGTFMCTNLEAARDSLSRVNALAEKAKYKMEIYAREKARQAEIKKG